MMNNDNTEAIWRFGKDIVVKSRDSIMNCVEQLFSASDFSREEILMNFQKLNLDEKAKFAVKNIIVYYLEGLMDSLFWNFEQSNGKYKIVTQDKNGRDFDIVTESDGLCTGQWEFIDRYSKYNTAEDVLKTGEIEKMPEEEITDTSQ